MTLTDAMRQTLDNYARTLDGEGRSDPEGMITRLAREHDLERPEAVAVYREWRRETLGDQERQSGDYRQDTEDYRTDQRRE
jgi:hypothetical protein